MAISVSGSSFTEYLYFQIPAGARVVRVDISWGATFTPTTYPAGEVYTSTAGAIKDVNAPGGELSLGGYAAGFMQSYTSVNFVCGSGSLYIHAIPYMNSETPYSVSGFSFGGIVYYEPTELINAFASTF